MSQYCLHCGALNDETLKICVECGRNLEPQTETTINLPPWSNEPKHQSVDPSPIDTNEHLDSLNQGDSDGSMLQNAEPSFSRFDQSLPTQSDELPTQEADWKYQADLIKAQTQNHSIEPQSSENSSSEISSSKISSSKIPSAGNGFIPSAYSFDFPSKPPNPTQAISRALWSDAPSNLGDSSVNPAPMIQPNISFDENRFNTMGEINQALNDHQSQRPDFASASVAPIHQQAVSRSPLPSLGAGPMEEPLPSRTLAPERLAQLYETPLVFLFGGQESLAEEQLPNQELWSRARTLLGHCAPILTDEVNEASIFLAFELPPRAWLQALSDLRPDGEVLVWLSEWPEGKTGNQLNHERTSAFYYGEEGLIELAVTLYRLASFHIPEGDPWWDQVRLRACLVEVEHFQRLIAQPQIDPFLVGLFAQRMRRWARQNQNAQWVNMARMSHTISGQLTIGDLAPDPLKALELAEDLLKYELMKRPSHLQGQQFALMTTLQDTHPEFQELLESFGGQISWFKHPQALINKIQEQYFHWCFFSEYVGPWDGFDLAQEARKCAPHIRVGVSVLARRTHIMARAEHLNIDLLLFPQDALSLQVIALSRALNSHQQQSGGTAKILKRLNAIQEAQRLQGAMQRTGLLLLKTEKEDPWLPSWLSKVDANRKALMPKSLSAQHVNDHLMAIPLAFDTEEPVMEFCTRVRMEVYSKLIAGCVLNQGPRMAESTIAEAYNRLDWAQLNRESLSLGWWRSGLEGLSSLGAQGAQILIVDSDPTSVDLLKFFSERAGLMVTTQNNGQDAVDLLQKLQYPPQLIIAECTLPYVSGFQILEASKQLNQGRPKVMLSSSLRRDELIERAFREGAADFLHKPFNMAEVMARVLHALE